MGDTGRVVVFGAGGRAGRAVTAEALGRGLAVTAVVRDPRRYPDLGTTGGAGGTGGTGLTGGTDVIGMTGGTGVTVVRGDVVDRTRVAEVAAGAVAAVHAVSPFSGPEQGFDALDPDFFVRAADALLGGVADAGVERLVAIGLFANLLGADGRPVMDDPEAFPPEIRPFALAHTAGLRRLLEAGDGPVDWVMLTPGGGLEEHAPRNGRYRFGGEHVPDDAGTAGPPGLSYADLAVAVVDEIERPTRHRARVSVFDPGALVPDVVDPPTQMDSA
ncbi:NAD(P)-dependent oxidoreductase [Streptomyces cellulosae]|uniref:NAD(P)-dependent oxidoreductase n=1 Tax=Streptomyces cellulosae TaxID=1968 RepID=A0ABW7Y1B2_STRCE